jgi:hypothetical protein
VVAGLVLVLLLVLVRGGIEIRERRAAEQEERRLQALVELETTPRFIGQGRRDIDPESRLGVVERAVGVRNNGPRDITVTAASLGDLRLVEEVVVPAGQDARLLLGWRGACAPRPALLAASDVIELEVRTQAGPAGRSCPCRRGSSHRHPRTGGGPADTCRSRRRRPSGCPTRSWGVARSSQKARSSTSGSGRCDWWLFALATACP